MHYATVDTGTFNNKFYPSLTQIQHPQENLHFDYANKRVFLHVLPIQCTASQKQDRNKTMQGRSFYLHPILRLRHHSGFQAHFHSWILTNRIYFYQTEVSRLMTQVPGSSFCEIQTVLTYAVGQEQVFFFLKKRFVQITRRNILHSCT